MTNELLNIYCMDVDSKTYWRNTNVNIDVLKAGAQWMKDNS